MTQGCRLQTPSLGLSLLCSEWSVVYLDAPIPRSLSPVSLVAPGRGSSQLSLRL